MVIDAQILSTQQLNQQIQNGENDIIVNNCLGHRFIGCGLDKNITVNGTAGNSLGAFMTGGFVTVNGNAQNTVGDTMSGGTIVVNGNAGSAVGYAMTGGEIYVSGNCSSRCGVHIKQCTGIPAIVVGGSIGSFGGEYMAGGVLVVLNLNGTTIDKTTASGMHGGVIYTCQQTQPILNSNVQTTKTDGNEIAIYLQTFCRLFGQKPDNLLSQTFYKITPKNANPFSKLYTKN